MDIYQHQDNYLFCETKIRIQNYSLCATSTISHHPCPTQAYQLEDGRRPCLLWHPMEGALMLGRLGQLGLNLMGGWMSQITVRLCSASVAGLLQGIWDPTNLRAVQHNQVLHSRDSTAWISKTCTTHLPIVRVCSSACDHASWILFHTVSNYGSYSHCSTLCDSIVQYMKENFGQKWSRHSPKTPRMGASWSDLPLPLPLPRATGTLDSLCCKLVSCTSPPVFACITLVLIGRTRASITLDWNALPPWISLPATPSARPRREVFKPGRCDATLDSLLDMTRVVIVDGRYNAVVRGLQHNILRCQKDKEKSICWKSIRFQTSSSVLQHCLHCFPRGVDKNSLAQSCGTPCMILFRFKQSAKQSKLPQIVISDNEGQAGKFLVIPFQRFHIIFMVPLCTSNIFDFAWQLSQVSS